MVLDALDQLASAQAIAAVATTLFTNVVDLGAVTPKRQIGDGEPIAMVVTIGVAADFTTGDETYEFEIIQSATANMASPTIIARQAVVATLLVAGAVVVLVIPPGYPTQEFISGQIVTAGTTPTVTFSAYFSPLSMVNVKPQTYASGFAVK